MTLFMPGEDLPGDQSRATAVIDRVLRMERSEVDLALAELRTRFADRRSLDEMFQRHFDFLADRFGSRMRPSVNHQLLIGAYFTHDVSPEGAALTNPSVVAHPDQSDLQPGELRVVLSVRAIGEGHISSIEFRTGVVTAEGQVRLDAPGAQLQPPNRQASTYRRTDFWAQLGEAGSADETGQLVLERVNATFDRSSLEQAISGIDAHSVARQTSRDTLSQLRCIADNHYKVAFAPTSAISDRILVPTGPAESNGIEDARFVRFVDDDSATTYFATYTAYDGHHVRSQLLRTDDFLTFTASQLAGPAAKNKGMALFPRRIGGRYACLSRWDRESSFVGWSDDATTWDGATPIHAPSQPWDLVQVGNCGSPLETADGWLVLTHGVGPMRTYSIGAMLLALDDPRHVLATLPVPLIEPRHGERSGYVPNVVYSCGGLLHGEHLILPYGFGDQAITIAVIDLRGLLNALVSAGT
jgi:predicted GH43/DUF377 family glycosyl hydrolase